MSLLEKLKAAGSIKVTTLAESTLFNDKDLVQTNVPIINVAFSGSLDGGIVSGLTVVGGPSKHYKSLLGLLCVSAYLDKYEDAVCLFYDSEFGISKEYLEANNIDPNRVIHIPIMHIEELKFDIMKRLEQIERKDKVFIFIDSLGNLASKKEIDDALDEKSVADMTRAKQGKSLFRMITPHLTTKDIPCFAVTHTYETMELYSKQIISGGKGIYYSAQTIFIVGRSQEKDGTEVTGWNFTLNVEKSRFVKEKSKLTFQVKYDGGIDRYSGLFDLALEAGFIQKSGSRYQLVDPETGEVNEKKMWAKDIGADVLDPLLQNERFIEFVKNKYKLTSRTKIEDSMGEEEGEEE
jgi:RecA/RadA recombinase